jgi:hypothetical protein
MSRLKTEQFMRKVKYCQKSNAKDRMRQQKHGDEIREWFKNQPSWYKSLSDFYDAIIPF